MGFTTVIASALDVAVSGSVVMIQTAYEFRHASPLVPIDLLSDDDVRCILDFVKLLKFGLLLGEMHQKEAFYLSIIALLPSDDVGR